MKKITSINKLALFCLFFLAVNLGLKAQSQYEHPNVSPNYIFPADSLSGFDEETAKQVVLNEGYFGEEFKVIMYYMKRDFVKAKYNLLSPEPLPVKNLPYSNSNTTAKDHPGNPVIAVAACNNEDFEEGGLTTPVPGTITVAAPLSVNGWTINSGSNSGSNASCVYKTMTGNPNAVWVMSGGSTGLIDPVIGAGYPIYSVFGNTTTTYPGATTANGFQCYGDWFIKMNNNTGGYTAHRMKKNINVTPANALFQFAFIAVLQSSHCCCTSGGFSIKVQLGCAPATPTLLGCPQFTATAPQASYCSGGVMACVSPSVGNTVTYLPAAAAGVSYNKWKLNTLDLTSYIGQCVTVEVEAFDCNAGGHYGYVYFDAQCMPMDIIGNGTSFPAGTPYINLPTCGSGNTATITAPSGLGPYLWTSPDPLVNGSTAQTIVTGVTGNHTITMNPPGSCAPITRTINVIISPAPNLALPTNTMYSCTQNTLNAVSLQMNSGTPSSASTPNYTVSFSPSAPTATTGTSVNTATYSGLSIGINTITITDSVGCTDTKTLNVTPAPQIPTLTINASQLVVGCSPPTVTIGVVNTNTNLTNMTYTWSSITTTGTPVTSNNSIIDVGAPTGSNTLTVTGSDPSSGCVATASCVLTSNTTAPDFTITPVLTQSIGCNEPCKQFTATASSTTNIFGTWYDITSATPVPLVGPSGGTIVLCAGTAGTYAMTFTNTVTGCTTTKTVAVTSNTSVPTLTVTSVLGGFKINCTKPCLPLNVNSNVVVGPTSYTWTNLTTSISTSPPTGGYTVCQTGANVPGQYAVTVKDGFGCAVSTTITISIDTLRPAPTSTATLNSLSPDSYTINCFTPSVVVTGVTNPMYPANNYSWTIPPNLIQSSQSATVSMVNVTASMPASTNYTVLAMNPDNGCVGRKLVRFYKDIIVPPYTVVFTPTAITCANPCVAFSPNNSTPSNTTPVTYTFTSPPPTQTATTLGALMCIPGPYTMTYQNAINGCTNVATTTVQLNVTPPSTFALTSVTIACGSPTAQLIAGHTGSTAAAGTYSYTWDGPTLAGMNCPGGAGCYSTTTNMSGEYNVFILNTINGCSATNSVSVYDGVISAGLTANPSTGFAPLTVGFDNTTVLQNTSSGTVTTTWNYGNGISMTYTGSSASYSLTGPPDGSSIYQSAGSYTVYMIVSQSTGTASCVGTASTVITVELPSKLEVPNVFTPNGDGVNDLFILQTTNLTEITCSIFDRWGVKMYDVTAEQGNIEWDGKNFGKKDVPAGTYFFILKAKGKDLVDYEQKGTISLYR